MHALQLDMFLTAGVGVLALMVGMWLTRKVPLLAKLCIPTPVTGGILFSLLTLGLYLLANVEVSFDGTIKEICMLVFFTSVGFQSDMKALKQGGKPLVVLVVLVTVLIILQNIIGVCVALGVGADLWVGMACGSIPMCGGHGTAGGFAQVLDSSGVTGLSSVALAAATFGLVAGSLLGGPLSERLVRRHNLYVAAEEDSTAEVKPTPISIPGPHKSGRVGSGALPHAVYRIVVAMALGVLLNMLLRLTGITFPTYFGALICAIVLRNVGIFGKIPEAEVSQIVRVGEVCLMLFLGMAMVSLKLWELAGLALPLLAILATQVFFIAFFAYFAAFPLLGGDYDAAVLVGGLCGFGLGATPNAMANMGAVCSRYRYALKPFLIVPVVGAMFVDIINTTVVTVFLNIL